ncbi:hypothetical protein [Nocardioides alcanivorans]|uniref:hypothetical protein n=1 Tax=Nocardioides alcanivorans TaxID=2897352 RepID=UPI001F1DDB49|nr:hypothetical protein [Nocardioides alcanivorans]
MLPGSGPDAFAGSVDEILAALDQDPVLVEEVMGNGNTESISAELSAKASTSPVPVFVVLTKAPPELTTDNTAEELLTLLHAQSGWDGVWFVSTADIGHTAVAVYGDVAPGIDNAETVLSSALSQATGAANTLIHHDCRHCSASPAADAGLVLDILNTGIPQTYGEQPLSDEQIEAYTTSTWVKPDTQTAFYDRAELPTPGLYAMVATLTAVCVFVAGYRLVQAIGGQGHPRLGTAAADAGRARPARPVDPQVELERARSRAVSAVAKLGRTLERKGDRIDWKRRDIAAACLERAESRTTSDDLLEVVGAEVLADTGLHAIARTEGQYRGCYVDPRHGRAATEASLGGGLHVPVCPTCDRRLTTGAALEPLLERRRFGSRRAYYEGSSVWATTGFGSLGGDWWQEVPR